MARIEIWWTIEQHELLDMLRRVAAGESPDAVLAEAYANGDHLAEDHVAIIDTDDAQPLYDVEGDPE